MSLWKYAYIITIKQEDKDIMGDSSRHYADGHISIRGQTDSVLADFSTKDLTKTELTTIKAGVYAIVKAVQKQLDLSTDKRKVNNCLLESKYKEQELEQEK